MDGIYLWCQRRSNRIHVLVCFNKPCRLREKGKCEDLKSNYEEIKEWTEDKRGKEEGEGSPKSVEAVSLRESEPRMRVVRVNPLPKRAPHHRKTVQGVKDTPPKLNGVVSKVPQVRDRSKRPRKPHKSVDVS